MNCSGFKGYRLKVAPFVVIWMLPICLANATEFEPEYEKAELFGPDDAEYSRVRVQRDWREFQDADGRRLAVDGDAVLVLPNEGEEEPRRVASVDGRDLRWLGAAEGIAFFVAENTLAEVADVEYGGDYLLAEIRRLDLDSLNWLPSWKVEPEADTQPRDCESNGPAPRISILGGLLTHDRAVVALTYTMAEKSRWLTDFSPEEIEEMSAEHLEWLKTSLNMEPLSFRVSCFDAKAERPTWSKTFSWADEPDPPAACWGWTDDRLELLTWLDPDAQMAGDAILVCAGEKQDLLCLRADDGHPRWRTPRLWEYERGYFGLTSAMHFVGPFGICDWLIPQEREEQREHSQALAKARKQFEETYEGSIIAGPVVVDDWRGDHIFIAAARRRTYGDSWWEGEPPPQCIVYEINAEYGGVIAASALPRMIEGRSFQTAPGALIWTCERGSLVRLHHSEAESTGEFLGRPVRGPSEDALCRIAWYREYVTRAPPCWFRATFPDGVAAFGPNRLFRLGAAYVRDQDEKVYCFNINVVDLETGMDHNLTLEVPFRGDFSIREYGHTFRSYPYLLGVTGLSIEGDVLRVIMKRYSEHERSTGFGPSYGPEEEEEDGEEVALEFDLATKQ